MNSNQLKEYLRIVTELEQSCFLQSQVKQGLEETIRRLGHERAYSPPVREPRDPKGGGILSTVATLVGGGILLGEILFFVTGMVLAGLEVYMLPLSSNGIFVIVGIVLTAAFIFFGEIKDASRRERKYQDQLAEYEKMVRADRVRVQRERTKAAYLRREAAKLDQIHARTVSVLRAVYDKNICFPKYRNFVAMWTIYEYICSGRCYTLEGENGAYNLYEMESRMDRILTKLDDVIKLLQKIKDQQFMLYHAIQDSNQKQQEILTAANHCADQIAQMGRNLSTISQQIDRQSAISQYQSEQTVKELEYMNRMNLFAGNYGSRS